MDMQLAGQHVVIFGAGNGIGRAIADGFENQGCRVTAIDLKPDAQRQVQAGDVTDYPQMSALAEQSGEVDHLVFAAGVGSGKFGFPFWNLEPADWTRVLDVNLIGAVNVAHAFAPKMAARQAGSLLFLVSVAGQIGSQTDPPYSAAKAGLINFVQCAARDLAASGVRVNALSPGMVRTTLNEAVWAASQARLAPDQRQDYSAWAEEKIRKVSPLGHWQTPQEFAAMAIFLASPHARNITGQTLNIDGGQVMHA